MTDDTHAAREKERVACHVAVLKQRILKPITSEDVSYNSAVVDCLNAIVRRGPRFARPLTAADGEKGGLLEAAAFLRANGWTVEEPRCETCEGMGVVWDNDGGCSACPTCNGTGARP